MKQKFILMVGVVLAAITFANAQKSRKMENVMTEEKAVIDFISAMGQSFDDNNIGEIMNCYEKDATVVFEPDQPLTDMQVVKQMFEGAMAAGGNMNFGEHEVFIQGNLAMHIVPWSMKVTAPDGTAIEQNGLSFGVLRKQKNGEWRFVIDNPHGSFVLNK